MTPSRGPELRSASIRVALTAAAVVAVVYLVIAVAVVAIVSRTLTSQIDDHLADSLQHVAPNPFGPPGDDSPGRPDDGPFDPVIVWQVAASGTVTSSDDAAVLPTAYIGVSDPQTIQIGTSTVRVRGAVMGDERVIVGQSMSSVSQAESTIILAEVIIAPLLLGVVFLGAVAIGRRVASPIEAARQRQLEFTADASHELRTPLSVIEAQTSLALSHDRSEAWYRTAFQRVDHESKRIRHLVEDLLWLARFDSTSGRPNAEPVDVGVLAAQTVDRFGIIAETRHISLSLATAAGTNVVTVPPEWLDRLLGVLLDNACKYAPDGGSVSVSVATDGARIRLTVDDSGPGIPPDERDRIFDRFHRATDAVGGAGLGLSIADAIVKATNGRWRIASSAAGGASMSVTWARAFAGPKEAALERLQPAEDLKTRR